MTLYIDTDQAVPGVVAWLPKIIHVQQRKMHDSAINQNTHFARTESKILC